MVTRVTGCEAVIVETQRINQNLIACWSWRTTANWFILGCSQKSLEFESHFPLRIK
jgi:hypothetical protein